MSDRNQGQPFPVPLTFPVRLTVGSHVYGLGTVTGMTGTEVAESMADLLTDVARAIRDDIVSPALAETGA